MSSSKNERARQDDTSSSPTPADITPTLNEKWAQHTFIEQIEISLGRKPVKDTWIERRTGKVVTYNRFKPDGLVVVRSLEMAFRALQMFDGRLRYQDEPIAPHLSEGYWVACARAFVAEYNSKHGLEPAGSGNVVAGQPNQERQQNDPSSCPPPADITPTLNEKWVLEALVEQIEISQGRKPVKETQFDRRTGKVITFDQFKPDGLVAARCLEIAFRALQMFDGRLRYHKVAPDISDAELVGQLRVIVAEWDAKHGPEPAAADSVVADQQDHQPGEPEAEPTVDQEKEPARRPVSDREWGVVSPPGHFPHKFGWIPKKTVQQPIEGQRHGF